jgi:hypothetical protein
VTSPRKNFCPRTDQIILNSPTRRCDRTRHGRPPPPCTHVCILYLVGSGMHCKIQHAMQIARTRAHASHSRARHARAMFPIQANGGYVYVYSARYDRMAQQLSALAFFALQCVDRCGAAAAPPAGLFVQPAAASCSTTGPAGTQQHTARPCSAAAPGAGGQCEVNNLPTLTRRLAEI